MTRCAAAPVLAPGRTRYWSSAAAGRPERVLALLATALLVHGLLLHEATSLLASAVIATSVLVLRSFDPGPALPVAAGASVAGATVVGLAAGLAGLPLLSSRAVGTGALVLVNGWALCCASRSPLRSGGRRSASLWIGSAPAALAGLAGVRQASSSDVVAGWALAGTDPAEHLLLLKGVQESGVLDYAGEAYPRGLHALLALVTSPVAEDAPRELLLQTLRLWGATTWFCLALLLWSVAAVVRHLVGDRVGPLTRELIALTGSAALPLTDAFMGALVYPGAAPSLLALSLVLGGVLVASDERHRGSTVAVATLVAVAVLSHLWQPLLLVPLLALAAAYGGNGIAVLRLWRSWPPRTWLMGLAQAVAASVAAAPAFLGVLSAGGASVAAIPGELATPPRLLVVACAAGLAGLALQAGERLARAVLGAAAGLSLVVLALATAAGGPSALGAYYPKKALWFLLVACWPAAAALAGHGVVRAVSAAWTACERLGARAQAARTVLTAICVALLGSYAAPPALMAAGYLRHANVAQADDDPVLRRLHLALDVHRRWGASRPVPIAVGVTSFPDHRAPYIVSKVLSFVTGQEQTYGRLADLCADVERAGGPGAGTVVSELDEATLRRLAEAQGCPDVAIARLPGGNPQGLALLQRGAASLLTPRPEPSD